MGEKISAMPAAAALTGTELVPVVQSGDNVKTTAQDIADLASAGAGYLVYTALLTQTGTDAPVAIVLQNTLGGALVWSRFDIGGYAATLAGVFTENKTFIIGNFFGNDLVVIRSFSASRVNIDSLNLFTFDIGGSQSDIFGNAAVPLYCFIEIRVYP